MGEAVKVRIFLALPLAPSFEAEVSPLILEMKERYPHTRWVPASEIHVTLHFFGSVEKDEISRITRLVEPLTKTEKALNLCLEGLGAFPNHSRPRVVWVGIRGDTVPLAALRNRIERRLKEEGYRCEEREFRPHATLGRIKEGKHGPGFNPVKFGPTAFKQVKELVLFQSHLTPQGAHYETIATYPLAAA